MREIQTSYGPLTLVPTSGGREMIQTDMNLGAVQYGLLMVNLKFLKEQNVKIVAPPADKPLPRKMRKRSHRRQRHAQT